MDVGCPKLGSLLHSPKTLTPNGTTLQFRPVSNHPLR
jgi:hypothetical protein